MALIDFLRKNYANSPEVAHLQDVLNNESEALKTAQTELFEQFHIDSATWGLTAWEKALEINTDASKSYEFRRERIRAKIRGTGTVTVKMIKDTAISYSNGEVEVIEYPEEYRIVIKFVGTIGLPPNMEDLIITIEEIKPAHLSVTFEYTYNTHNELKRFTHLQLAEYTHQQLREEAIS